MKKMTKQNFQQAMREMQAGNIIEFIPDAGSHYPSRVGCRCGITKCRGETFIHYCAFGSSAVKWSFKSLRWVADIMGSCTTGEFKVVPGYYTDGGTVRGGAYCG